MAPTPVQPPDLGIPQSTSTVSVSVIDTTTSIRGIPSWKFFTSNIKGNEWLAAPAFSYLVEHPALKRSILFDLGVRKDHENCSKVLLEHIKEGGYTVTVEKDVRQILEEGGFDPKKLEAVVWSHYHWDHTGDPSRFEPHTALIVGPGFKEKLAPGYPANPKSTFLESDYAGRELREVSFEQDGVINIGKLKAVDYFGDGSFYFLDTPGHAIGHIAGLARVTSKPDSFILMGGDTCHHGGELRPSKFLPIPDNISPNPFTPFTAASKPCPGAMFEKLLPDEASIKPLCELSTAGGIHFDIQEAARTIEKIQEADCRDNVLFAMAHDETLLDVVEFFPKTANDFMAKGWAKKLRWLFLRDFAEVVGYDGPIDGKRDWSPV